MYQTVNEVTTLYLT